MNTDAMPNATPLTRFLIEEQRRLNAAPGSAVTGGLTALIHDVRLACKRIAALIGKGALANARSMRNALDRARLRQASRLFERRGAPITREDLETIETADIRASRVFAEEGAHEH